MIHTEIHFVSYPENTDICFFTVTIGMTVLPLQVMCPLHQKEENFTVTTSRFNISHFSLTEYLLKRYAQN